VSSSQSIQTSGSWGAEFNKELQCFVFPVGVLVGRATQEGEYYLNCSVGSAQNPMEKRVAHTKRKATTRATRGSVKLESEGGLTFCKSGLFALEAGDPTNMVCELIHIGKRNMFDSTMHSQEAFVASPFRNKLANQNVASNDSLNELFNEEKLDDTFEPFCLPSRTNVQLEIRLEDAYRNVYPENKFPSLKDLLFRFKVEASSISNETNFVCSQECDLKRSMKIDPHGVVTFPEVVIRFGEFASKPGLAVLKVSSQAFRELGFDPVICIPLKIKPFRYVSKLQVWDAGSAPVDEASDKASGSSTTVNLSTRNAGSWMPTLLCAGLNNFGERDFDGRCLEKVTAVVYRQAQDSSTLQLLPAQFSVSPANDPTGNAHFSIQYDGGVLMEGPSLDADSKQQGLITQAGHYEIVVTYIEKADSIEKFLSEEEKRVCVRVCFSVLPDRPSALKISRLLREEKKFDYSNLPACIYVSNSTEVSRRIANSLEVRAFDKYGNVLPPPAQPQAGSLTLSDAQGFDCCSGAAVFRVSVNASVEEGGDNEGEAAQCCSISEEPHGPASMLARQSFVGGAASVLRNTAEAVPGAAVFTNVDIRDNSAALESVYTIRIDARAVSCSGSGAVSSAVSSSSSSGGKLKACFLRFYFSDDVQRVSQLSEHEHKMREMREEHMKMMEIHTRNYDRVHAQYQELTQLKKWVAENALKVKEWCGKCGVQLPGDIKGVPPATITALKRKLEEQVSMQHTPPRLPDHAQAAGRVGRGYIGRLAELAVLPSEPLARLLSWELEEMGGLNLHVVSTYQESLDRLRQPQVCFDELDARSCDRPVVALGNVHPSLLVDQLRFPKEAIDRMQAVFPHQSESQLETSLLNLFARVFGEKTLVVGNKAEATQYRELYQQEYKMECPKILSKDGFRTSFIRGGSVNEAPSWDSLRQRFGVQIEHQDDQNPAKALELVNEFEAKQEKEIRGLRVYYTEYNKVKEIKTRSDAIAVEYQKLKESQESLKLRKLNPPLDVSALKPLEQLSFESIEPLAACPAPQPPSTSSSSLQQPSDPPPPQISTKKKKKKKRKRDTFGDSEMEIDHHSHVGLPSLPSHLQPSQGSNAQFDQICDRDSVVAKKAKAEEPSDQ